MDKDQVEQKLTVNRCFESLFVFMEIIVIILFITCTTYNFKGDEKDPAKIQLQQIETMQSVYPMMQDVHVMIYIGFGFLMVFLKTSSWTAVGFNFLLSAWVF